MNTKVESAEIVASIDDLLIEILLRLSTKFLVRLKIVSKQWHSLIANPVFCRRRNSAVGLLFPRIIQWPNYLFNYVPFSPNHSTIPQFKKLRISGEPSGIRVVQSCNGLLLVCSFQPHWDNTTHYYVYNPTTNQHSTILKLQGAVRFISGMGLAFDPVKSPHYSVVCVYNDPKLVSAFGRKQYQLQIYSSETRAWKISGQPFNAQVFFEGGVYWNGAVHWINYSCVNTYSFYFNVHQHMLAKMPNPPNPDTGFGRMAYYVGESCDHLHYIQTRCSQIKFNVYEMKRDYSELFVKYHVDVSTAASTNTGLINSYNFPIFCMVRGEEEENDFLVLQIGGKAIRYNLVSKTFEKLLDLGGVDVSNVLQFPSINGFQFIESLCSV